MNLLTSNHWTDYELVDSGNREKLERFGPFTLIRPEPQAVWAKALSEEEWNFSADAWYRKSGGKEVRKTEGQVVRGSVIDEEKRPEGERGQWNRKPGMPEQWIISYKYREMSLKFRLGLTAFGHIGVFPEQAGNWEFIYDFLNPSPGTKAQGSPCKILNLFAYTGGASLAAKAAGADVTHVDSVRPVITWAREIMETSGLEGIRWVVEDALKFVRREARRGNLYDGIILDPPAYGRGPEGEKWVLEESINEIVSLCSRILRTERSFFILSLYSMGFSPLIGENLLKTHFPGRTNLESGEFCFIDRAGRKLPLGTCVRF
jgi:23S rRNA (cytosine1962-C5)-methyltransferase